MVQTKHLFLFISGFGVICLVALVFFLMNHEPEPVVVRHSEVQFANAIASFTIASNTKDTRAEARRTLLSELKEYISQDTRSVHNDNHMTSSPSTADRETAPTVGTNSGD